MGEWWSILLQGERELEFAKTKKKQCKFLFILNYSSACFVLMEFLKGLFFPDLRLGWNHTVLESEASQKGGKKKQKKNNDLMHWHS